MRAWIDGVASPEAAVSVLDETFLRGDGCFEALRSYGGRLFDVESHLNRLERSARALEMAMPLRRDLVEWLNVAGAEGGDCVVRLVLTRGPASGLGSAIIIVQPVPDRPAAYRLATVEAPWHPAGRSWDLAGVKSVSYAPNMAASRRATHAGAHDALLVSGGTILEGPTFSVGWIVDGVLETPPRPGDPRLGDTQARPPRCRGRRSAGRGGDLAGLAPRGCQRSDGVVDDQGDRSRRWNRRTQVRAGSGHRDACEGVWRRSQSMRSQGGSITAPSNSASRRTRPARVMSVASNALHSRVSINGGRKSGAVDRVNTPLASTLVTG